MQTRKKQKRKAKAKKNEQTLFFSGKTRMEYKRRIRVTNKKLTSKTKTSQRSRWSTSTDAPSSCGTTIPCCCKCAGILKREICADEVRVLFKQHHHLLQQTIFELSVHRMVMENRPVDPGSIQGSHRPISFIRIKHRTRANDILCKTEY